MLASTILVGDCTILELNHVRFLVSHARIRKLPCPPIRVLVEVWVTYDLGCFNSCHAGLQPMEVLADTLVGLISRATRRQELPDVDFARMLIARGGRRLGPD